MKNLRFSALFVLTFSPALSAQESYIVKGGDTLWGIADILYSEPAKWKEIYELNQGRVADPNLIYPQQVLLLPLTQKENAAEEFVAENTQPSVEEPQMSTIAPVPQEATAVAAPSELSNPTEAAPSVSEEPAPAPIQEPATKPRPTKTPHSDSGRYDGVIIGVVGDSKTMLAQGDRVALDIGFKSGLVEGDELSIVRRDKKIKDKKTKQITWIMKPLGKIRLLEVNETKSEAVILLSNDPVYAGDGVVAFHR